PLTNEEMLILIEKLADIHAGLYEYPQIVTQQDMIDFIEIEFGRIGADTHITPREVIRDFIEVLDIVYQNPGVKVRQLLGSDQFTYARNDVIGEATEDQFAEFDI
ncbi:MAG: ATP-binding protein, partial [Clostridiales bacterium]|nr:ATP-binding protein [Clostridiales bacterium]